jgi:hypothetical protein
MARKILFLAVIILLFFCNSSFAYYFIVKNDTNSPLQFSKTEEKCVAKTDAPNAFTIPAKDSKKFYVGRGSCWGKTAKMDFDVSFQVHFEFPMTTIRFKVAHIQYKESWLVPEAQGEGRIFDKKFSLKVDTYMDYNEVRAYYKNYEVISFTLTNT